MIEEYRQLVKDALLFLKQQKVSHIFAENADHEFFQTTITKKISPILSPKPKPLAKVQSKPILHPPPQKKAPPPIIEREIPKTVITESLQDIRHLVQRLAPQLSILDTIPDDSKAKQISQQWKTQTQAAPITLLSLKESLKERTFLQNVAKALERNFYPAAVVSAFPLEQENKWEMFLATSHLKLLICCDYSIWELKKLMQYYKEIPSTSERFLAKVPLFLLPNISLYLQDPSLKRSLWKALCQKMHMLPSS